MTDHPHAPTIAPGSLLKALPDEARARLIARGAEVRLKPLEALFAKGEPGDALYLVLEGEIEVGVSTEGGRYVRFAALPAGAVLGELAALDGGPRSADARAARRARLLKVSRDALFDVLAQEPAVAHGLLAELARRLRHADEAIEAAVLLDLPAKAAKLLLEESGHGARAVALNQTEMARRISVSREKLNRRLHQWVDEGAVELTRAGVKILAPEKLAQLVRRRSED